MAEMCNAIDENQLNQFILVPKHQIEFSREIRGRIVQQKEGKIYIEIRNIESFNSVDTTEKYIIRFQVIRKNFDLQMDALHYIGKHKLFNCLIKNPDYHRIGEIVQKTQVNYDLSSDNKKRVNILYYTPLSRDDCNENMFSFNRFHQSSIFTSLNAEQKTAVVNIFDGNNYPLPYLLYGPPGSWFFFHSKRESFQNSYDLSRDG